MRVCTEYRTALRGRTTGLLPLHPPRITVVTPYGALPHVRLAPRLIAALPVLATGTVSATIPTMRSHQNILFAHRSERTLYHLQVMNTPLIWTHSASYQTLTPKRGTKSRCPVRDKVVSAGATAPLRQGLACPNSETTQPASRRN